jgi:hypothetical protein
MGLLLFLSGIVYLAVVMATSLFSNSYLSYVLLFIFSALCSYSTGYAYQGRQKLKKVLRLYKMFISISKL